MGLYKIIVEIDEYQHSSYDIKCEMTRLFQIHQDLDGSSVLFIGFNPDSYKVNNVKQNIRFVTKMNELFKYI